MRQQTLSSNALCARMRDATLHDPHPLHKLVLGPVQAHLGVWINGG